MTHRIKIFALALAALTVATSAGARSSIEMTTGIRYVYDTGTAQECGAKAKAALNFFLQDATETPDGSGDWTASGPGLTSAAVVHCLALPKGYAVTFTCAIQAPGSFYHAADLCLDVAHQFAGKPTVPLATPTPMPTGCSTINLVGTWVSDHRDGPTLKMDVNGSLISDDGVSGSWYLNGTTATITYYGDHVTTLSADGKHLDGDGYHLTRQC